MSDTDKKTILVVDDDREIVRAISITLEREGYNVLKAYDGLEALDCVTSRDIHLIIIDVMMPRLDGLSAVMKIREKKNLPIIILSAKGEDSDKIIGLSMGADDYIVNGRLTFRTDEHVLYADGEPVKLTATETKIVELLMKHPGRIFPAEEIYSLIWNEPAYSAENTVMVHIRRIREKIEINPSEPEYLKVVWGLGYEIEKH